MLTLSEAVRYLPTRVACANSLDQLYRNERLWNELGSIRLVGTLGAVRTSAIEGLMGCPVWPLDLLTGSVLDTGQFWSISRGGVAEEPFGPRHLALIRAATGADGDPHGNLRLTWSVRRYSERDDRMGSLAWLETALQRHLSRRGLLTELLHRLVRLFLLARSAGAELFLEQLTVVLAKDASSPNPCLTPRLHADEYYGYRETAIASLLEPGWSTRGGTWFLPTLTMRDIPDGDGLMPERIDERFPDTPIVGAGNGDLCIYDGMRGATGAKSQDLGTPHISGDLPGASARLVVLMHHRPPNSQPAISLS